MAFRHHLGQLTLQRLDAVAFESRNHEGVGERHSLVQFGGHFEQPRALDQVDLVEDQDFRPLQLRQLFEDRLGLLVDAFAHVQQQGHHIGIRRSAPGRGDHGPIEAALRLEDAGRVHEHDLSLALEGDAAHERPRGLDLVGDNRDLGADQRIEERRLPRIRCPDQGHEAGPSPGLALRIRSGFNLRA